MKKILVVLVLLVGFIALPVYAVQGNNNSSKSQSNATTKSEAREKRSTIRLQKQELVALREQLKLKLSAQREVINQYREKTELTEEERANLTSMIAIMKTVKEKLSLAYQNANQALKDFKGDKSTDKLTGLDLVIESQKYRILRLQDAIAAFGE